MGNIIIIGMILVNLAGCSYSDLYNRSDVQKNMEEGAVVSVNKTYSKDDFVNFIKLGMTTEIEEKFGEPDLTLGSGFIIVGYYLNDNTIIELNFGTGKNGLQSARIIGNNADIFNRDVIEEIELTN